ncbi:MAG: DivIVA domain-containing protein [Eubacteriales bacterium]|nr:DivIVA domain-containing protein [Eubacteriales bacterium]
MITAQDIREKTFEKSKFGGYDMAEVDDFLEELADELTSTQKETSVLKSKMKVLVDKIEEYRSNESALNQSILSAQKLAQQIESEAREKADNMIAEANRQVEEKLGGITEKTDYEEKRLAAAQAASAKFLDGIRAMCNAQLKNIENISNATLETPAAAPAAPAQEQVKEKSSEAARRARSAERAARAVADVDAAVRKIDASVSKIKPEPSVKMDLDLDVDADNADSEKDFDSTQPFSI